MSDSNMGGGGGKWSPQNCRKRSEREMSKTTAQQRSKYLAYEEPTKEIADRQKEAKQRILERSKQDKLINQRPSDEEMNERIQHEKLIGQLKAAEARNRIRIMRLRHQANRAEELSHLIASQPSAATAIRLEALVPTKDDKRCNAGQRPRIDKLSKERIEHLIDDDLGLLTIRS